MFGQAGSRGVPRVERALAHGAQAADAGAVGLALHLSSHSLLHGAAGVHAADPRGQGGAAAAPQQLRELFVFGSRIWNEVPTAV